jgi:hypothetical protein
LFFQPSDFFQAAAVTLGPAETGVEKAFDQILGQS